MFNRFLPKALSLFSLLGLSVSVHVSAQVKLEYRHYEEDKWHITSEVEEEVFVDGQLVFEAEILNKISVEILSGEGRDGELRNIYSIAESRKGSDVYAWSGEYESSYRRDTRGQLSHLTDRTTVPTVRNVPVYPDYSVSPGEKWIAAGTEVFDLSPAYGIPEIIYIDFDASYVYQGPLIYDGKDVEEISIEYGFFWQPEFEVLLSLQQYEIYPVSVVGDFRQVVYFDSAAGRNYYSEGEFSYTYIMSDGFVNTFRGSSIGKAVYVDPLDKKALVREIEDLQREDMKAEAVEEGVKISLEDLNFVADEATLLKGQESKLAAILEVLRRYPDRDVQVVGHTARIQGSGHGQVLSEERAQTVAQLVIDAEVRSRDRITIRGMGDADPIGDNATDSGRRLNRRVEIIILEN